MQNLAKISKIKGNIMGTTDIVMRIKGMRKDQRFIVYPIHKDNSEKVIKIQSDTRIGLINLETGAGKMSKPHSSGAYFVHLQMDPITHFHISALDLQTLKMHIFTTAGEKVGNRIVSTDNSGAKRVL